LSSSWIWFADSSSSSPYNQGKVFGSKPDLPSQSLKYPYTLPGWIIWFEGVKVKDRKFGIEAQGVAQRYEAIEVILSI